MDSAPLPPLEYYPERADAHDSWLRSLETSVTRLIHVCVEAWPDGSAKRLTRSTRDARQLSDNELKAEVASLRHVIIRQGWTRANLDDLLVLMSMGSHCVFASPCDLKQVLGARALLQGRLIELPVRSDRTRAIAIAAATAALAGKNVHVIESNEDLAESDLRRMKPLYDFFGIKATNLRADAEHDERCSAYRADIVYVSAWDVSGDYLSDKLDARRPSHELQYKVDRLKDKGRPFETRLRGLPFAIIADADHVLLDQALVPRLIMGRMDALSERAWASDAMKLVIDFESGSDFVLTENQALELTEHGKGKLRENATELSGIWRNTSRREDAARKALLASHVYHCDQDYRVVDGRVTDIRILGKQLTDRKDWNEGVEQLVELKEGCEVSGRTVVKGRITYQRLFPRYQMLAGASAAARESAGELWSIYRLRIKRIGSAGSKRRHSAKLQLLPSKDAQLARLISRHRTLGTTGVPIVFAARTSSAALQLQQAFEAQDTECFVVGGSKKRDEEELLETVKKSRAVLVLFMCSDGKALVHDAQLFENEEKYHLVKIELQESRRLERQLDLRLGGEALSVESVLSMEDAVLRTASTSQRLTVSFCRGVFSRQLSPFFLGFARWNLERLQARARRDILTVDRKQGLLLAFTGAGE